MALNQLGLGFIFTARDLASGTMAKLEGRFGRLDRQTRDSLGRFQKTTSGFIRGFGLMAAGGIGVMASLKIGRSAGEFEQGLAAISAVTKATTSELNMLEQAATRAGIETQFSPKEAVDGLQSLATAGQTATQATKTLNPVLDLAAGSLGQLGVAGAAEAVVGTLNAYQKSADEAADVTDKLLRITQLTNFQARDFEAGLSKAAAAGATFGTSLEDTLITLGQLRNANIDASSASTAYREATRRLFSDKNVQNKIEKEGIDLYDKTTGAARSTVDVMLDMVDATEKMTEKQRGQFVAQALGARGLLAFNAVSKATFNKTMPDGTVQVLKGRDAIEALRGEMEGAEGTAEDFRKQLLNTFEGQKTLLQGTMETIGVVAGKEFAQVLKPVVGAVVDGLNFFIQVIQATPAPIKRMVAATIMFASAVAGLTGALVIGKLAFKLFRREAHRALLSMLPFLKIFAVAAVAFFLFRRAYERNIGGFADFVDNIFGKVKLTIGALAELFTKGEITENAEALMDPANRSILNFVEVISVNMARAEAFFDAFIEGVGEGLELLEPIIEAVIDGFKWLAEVFGINVSAGDDLEGTLDTVRSVGATIGRLLPILVTGWLAYKAAVIAVTTASAAGKLALLGYKGAVLAVKAAQAAGGVAASGFRMALLGKAGLVAAAGAAGYAFGTWLDKTFKLSDGLADLMGDITGLNKELKALEDAAGGRTTKRGADFLTVEDHAKKAGMSTDDWLDKRASEMAGESWAKDRGISKATIRERLAKGQDPIAGGGGTDVAAKASMAAHALAKTEGELERARAGRSTVRQDKLEKLQAQQLAVLKEIMQKNPNIKLEVDGRRFAEIQQRIDSMSAAEEFGAMAGVEGV